MNKALFGLLSRIKGAKLYCTPYCGQRVYIPYTLTYPPSKVRIKVYFEILNDRLALNVTVLSEEHTSSWCKLEEERLKQILSEQFHEILYNCELKWKKTPLSARLKDSTIPYTEKTLSHQRQAILFLCEMKVSLLIADSQADKRFIAIRVAQSRYLCRRINKLFIYAPQNQIKDFRKDLSEVEGLIQVFYTAIESLSHNPELYLQLLEYTDAESMLVINDCHLFKSPTSIRSQRMLDIADKCNYKLLITSTITTNNLHDVYMQYRILNKDILGYYQWSDFSRMHIIYGGIGGDQILGYKNLSYLSGLADPYTYAIEERKTLDSRIPVKTYICDLTFWQKYFYKKKKSELLALIDKHELQVYDVFRIMGEMQKIVCGCITIKHNKRNFFKINKLILLRECTGEMPCIIICKYLFEIELLTSYLGEKACAVYCGKNRKERQSEKEQFMTNKKQYFISTLNAQDIDLNELNEVCDIVFFSLSFKYMDYKRNLTFIAENNLESTVSVMRFTTNSGIDRKIMENINRKGKLADEMKKLFANKNQLKDFVRSL